jgi:hypothetical protein
MGERWHSSGATTQVIDSRELFFLQRGSNCKENAKEEEGGVIFLAMFTESTIRPDTIH